MDPLFELAQDPLPGLDPEVAIMPAFFMCLLQEEDSNCDSTGEDNRANQVW